MTTPCRPSRRRESRAVIHLVEAYLFYSGLTKTTSYTQHTHSTRPNLCRAERSLRAHGWGAAGDLPHPHRFARIICHPGRQQHLNVWLGVEGGENRKSRRRSLLSHPDTTQPVKSLPCSRCRYRTWTREVQKHAHSLPSTRKNNQPARGPRAGRGATIF